MNYKILLLLGCAFALSGCDKLRKAQLEKAREHLSEAKGAQVKLQFAELKVALEMFKIDCLRYPTNEEGLLALEQKPADCASWGPDPYLLKVQKDPWNKDLIYKMENDSFTLSSLGADGVPGGEGENKDFSFEGKKPAP